MKNLFECKTEEEKIEVLSEMIEDTWYLIRGLRKDITEIKKNLDEIDVDAINNICNRVLEKFEVNEDGKRI